MSHNYVLRTLFYVFLEISCRSFIHLNLFVYYFVQSIIYKYYIQLTILHTKSRNLDVSSAPLDTIEDEILSTYSKLASKQCNFTTPLSTLITAAPGDSCPFRVRIGIARLGVDIVEDVSAENNEDDDETTVFLEGTRDLIVWNMDRENDEFKCFHDMTMNTTTTTATSSNKQEVVERGDDIMIFFPTDVLSNGVENMVSAPGLYQMVDGMVGWSTDTASGISNVTKIEGVFVDLCEDLGGGGSGSSLTFVDTISAGEQLDPPPSSSNNGGDPTVSIFNAESPSSGFALMQGPLRVFGMCLLVVFVMY